MTGAFVLITLGVLFLLNNLYPADFRFARMWPVILIVIGVVKIVEYFQGPATVAAGDEPPERPVRPPLPAAPKPPVAPVAPRARKDSLPAGKLTSPTRQSSGYTGDDIPAPKKEGEEDKGEAK